MNSPPAGRRSPEGTVLRDIPGRWPVVKSAETFRGAIVTIRTDQVRMPGGGEADREVVQHPGAVAVVALDDAGLVLLIRQYRHPVGWQLWELPAGLRDVRGEQAQSTAERELLEETGYRAGDWKVLVDYFSSPGISNERLRIYLARDLTEVPESQRGYVRVDEEAYLEPAWVPIDDAVAGLLSGDLHNGVTAVGILSAYAARQDGFAALRDADAPER